VQAVVQTAVGPPVARFRSRAVVGLAPALGVQIEGPVGANGFLEAAVVAVGRLGRGQVGHVGMQESGGRE